MGLMRQRDEPPGRRAEIEKEHERRLPARGTGPVRAPDAGHDARVRCASCGAANDEDARFCKSCGTRLPAAPDA
jgi:hypothetical protein